MAERDVSGLAAALAGAACGNGRRMEPAGVPWPASSSGGARSPLDLVVCEGATTHWFP
jgi:hypothetical protein